ncbi:hypothetical protein [Cryobacterium fucosi]|nr:hypothetical protein [Cryobacterium fucosi]
MTEQTISAEATAPVGTTAVTPVPTIELLGEAGGGCCGGGSCGI